MLGAVRRKSRGPIAPVDHRPIRRRSPGRPLERKGRTRPPPTGFNPTPAPHVSTSPRCTSHPAFTTTSALKPSGPLRRSGRRSGSRTLPRPAATSKRPFWRSRVTERATAASPTIKKQLGPVCPEHLSSLPGTTLFADHGGAESGAHSSGGPHDSLLALVVRRWRHLTAEQCLAIVRIATSDTGAVRVAGPATRDRNPSRP